MKSRKAEKELSASLHRDPTQAEIADKVGITEQRLHALRKVMPYAGHPHFQFIVVRIKLCCRLHGCRLVPVKRHHVISHGRTSELVIGGLVVSCWLVVALTVLYWHCTVILSTFHLVVWLCLLRMCLSSCHRSIIGESKDVSSAGCQSLTSALQFPAVACTTLLGHATALC